MISELHVICFDVPYPADYGGVIDVYYKLRMLHSLGVRLHIHCYEYGRHRQPELDEIAASVHYYPRKSSKSLLFNTHPYIVLSRNSPELRERLLKDDHPVLMEGIHSTSLLMDPAFAGRKIVVRTHNVEHDYYQNLARVEKDIFKRYYFYNEAGKLRKYEPVLKKASAIAAISPSDAGYFGSIFPKVGYVPAFHPFEKVETKPGRGDFAFYHGNLSVGENNEAALFLVTKVFAESPYRLLIAGSKPSVELIRACRLNPNVTLIDKLSPEEIYSNIGNAQCNVLPTFQATGIKLKLLAALFKGRACIVNPPMVEGTGLESLCDIADSAGEMMKLVASAMSEDINPEKIRLREKILHETFSNSANAKKLLELFG
jgi:hypothetical protein